ncbi:exported hypothetical protein [Gammaproteobacteria bacterium]
MCARIFRLAFQTLMLILALGTSAACLADAAARVEFVSGAASITDRSGTTTTIQKGVAVNSGQTLETTTGSLQIRFTDGSRFSLPPKTVFRVDDYSYDNRQDGSKRGFFSLLKGGLRTITGVIGRLHNENYRVVARAATIGVRGTHYLLRDCENDCVNAQGQLDKDGLYAFVTHGAIHVENNAGSLDVTAGNAAFVADQLTMPQQVDHLPQVLPPGEQSGTEKDGDEHSAAQSRIESGLEQSEATMRSLAGLAPNIENPSGFHEEGESFLGTVKSGFQAGQDVFKVDGRYIIANLKDIEGGAASNVSGLSSRGTLAEIETNVAAYLDPAGAIRVVTNATGSASNNTAGVYDTYSDGDLFLARWGGPGQTGGSLNLSLQGNQSVHWLLLKPYESPLPKAGNATYNMIAATQPTSSSPIAPTGAMNSATVTVNFGGNSAYGGLPFARYELNSNLFHATGDAGIDAIGDFETGNNGTLSGIATGSACETACTAYVHGMFAGRGVSRGNITIPSGMGFLYEIRASPTSTYHGSIGLKP